PGTAAATVATMVAVSISWYFLVAYCSLEILLLLSRASPSGLDRKALGRSSKFPSTTVTRTIQRLEADRYLHKTRNGTFHITGPGEHFLTGSLVEANYLPTRSRAARGQTSFSGKARPSADLRTQLARKPHLRNAYVEDGLSRTPSVCGSRP